MKKAEISQRLSQELRDEFDRSRRLGNDASQAIKENDRLAQDLRKQQQTGFNDLVRSSREDIDRFKKFFSGELALQAPVTYWRKKRRWHIGMAIVWFIAVIVGAYVAYRLLASEWDFLFQHTRTETGVEWWRIGSFVIFATFALWVVRIMVQMFMSNVHLATDAAERVTMIQAYLALLKEEKAIITPEDKRVILAAIFRPATSGVVKDDGGPSTLLEKFTRHVDRSR